MFVFGHRLRGVIGAIVVTLACTHTVSSQDVSRIKVDDPEDVTLPTRDGVELRATYYKSSAGQENGVPVVILHDYKGSRASLDSLARVLQIPAEGQISQSRAVVTVDLRGHGGSVLGRGPGGREIELDVSKFRPVDFVNMVNFDMEAVRSFLVEKNDAGELNLNRLCIVGVGMGSSIALNWAARDWSAPPLTSGKQGQDVKGLVLISPRWNYRGLAVRNALQHPGVRSQISFLIVFGNQKQSLRVARDSMRIHTQLERFHPKPPPQLAAEKQTLFLRELPTTLQGTELLNQRAFEVDLDIADFIELRIASQSFPWSKRRKE